MSFQEAVTYVNSLPKDGPVQLDNAEKLEFYAYYKQATVGDVNIAQPWAVQIEARSKWDSWKTKEGMSKADCEAAYVKLLTDTVQAKNGKNWKE